ncbi:hypothetical protein [Streptomyces sp. NPDC003401]
MLSAFAHDGRYAGMVIAALPVVLLFLLFLFGQRYIVKGLADGIGK